MMNFVEYADNDFSDGTFTNIEDVIEFISDRSDTLNLNNNKITIVDLSLIPSNIKKIHINNNIIETIIFDNREWEEVNLKKNYITNILYCNLKIKKLNMTEAFEGTTINIKFIGCIIDELNVSNNCLSSVLFENTYVEKYTAEDCCFRELISLPIGLTKLYFGKNELKRICVKFEDTLKVLDLENNELEEIDFELPKSLERFNVSNNQIKKINIKLPENMTHFDICNNRLVSIDNLVLNDKLRYIDLSSNKIVNIDKNRLTRINYADISNNICDDDSDSESSIHIKTIHNNGDDVLGDDVMSVDEDLYGDIGNGFSEYRPTYDFESNSNGLNNNESRGDMLDDFIEIDTSDITNNSTNNTTYPSGIEQLFEEENHSNRITRGQNNRKLTFQTDDLVSTYGTLAQYYKSQMGNSQITTYCEPQPKKVNMKKRQIELRWN